MRIKFKKILQIEKKIIFFTLLLIGIFFFGRTAFAATEFTATVMPSGQGGDYTSLFDAEAGLNNNLTLATIKVFSISAASNPTIAAGDTVLGQTSGATGVCVLVNAARTQILIKTIAVAAFQSGEVVQKTGSAGVNVTLSSAGDSPIVGIKIDGAWTDPDTTAVVIDGWTTSAADYIRIYTTAAAKHNGKWNTSKYRLLLANATVLTINEDYVNVDGLQLMSSGHNANDQKVIWISGQTNGSNQINLSTLFLDRTIGTTAVEEGIYVQSTYGNVNIWNSVIIGSGDYNWSNHNAAVYVASGNVNIYNSTLETSASHATGLSVDSGVVVAKNVYAKGSSTHAFYAYGGSLTLTTCASSDATGSVGLQNIAFNTTNFTNVTTDTEDVHLPVGSALINVGTDTSGDAAPLNFTTDIDGQTRSGTWDVGADEYVAASRIIRLRNTRLLNARLR